nr:hypothetical protein [Roseibium sp. MMSF_3544]
MTTTEPDALIRRCHFRVRCILGSLSDRNKRRDKSHSPATHCPYVALNVSVVAQGAAQITQSTCNSGIGHEAAVPDRVYEFFLRNHSVGLINQVNQQVENKRLYGDPVGPTPEFQCGSIYEEIVKRVFHRLHLARTRNPFEEYCARNGFSVADI